MISFDGRVAIITGAGGGLGRSHALDLASRGAKVVVNDLGGSTDGEGNTTGPADTVVAEIKAAGGEAVASYDSVTSTEGGKAITQLALDTWGRVDIVINNAGILRDKSFLKLELEDLRAVLEVHLIGAINVTQPAFAVMKERGYGRILFTASGAGAFGNFGQTNYAAAKSSLIGVSNVLSQEGAKNNITSNVILPIAQTRLTGDMPGMGDVLTPARITPIVTWLVSEGCTETHNIYNVGGGRFARVFIGSARGWMAPGDTVTAEDVMEHQAQIEDLEGWAIPDNAVDDMGVLLEQLKAKS
jgi:NAD(P)-dependent dehydrogenase (short-subunit alcohol dehydrogenase family)